jgi:3-oxoacid CoA-transferase B subunit
LEWFRRGGCNIRLTLTKAVNMAKWKLTRSGIAARAAQEFREGTVVNLGTGIPSLCSGFLPPDGEILLHSEQGLIGYGSRAQTQDQLDPNLLNAARQPVTPKRGMCIVDHAESFNMIRGGWIDVSVLGALQVSSWGGLANCWLPGKHAPGIGGAQDLAFCAKRVIAVMPLASGALRERLVPDLKLEATAPACVETVVTDVGVVDVTAKGFVLREVVMGLSIHDVRPLLHAEIDVSETSSAAPLGPTAYEEFRY